MAENTYRYIITLILPDRIGILKDITTAVADAGGNIDAISQTILADYFTVTLTSSFVSKQDEDTLKITIGEAFSSDCLSVTVLEHKAGKQKKSATRVGRYIVTLIGQDSPGIIKAITTYFASKHVNIEDWTIQYENNQVVHIGEVTIPTQLDLKQVQAEFIASISQFDLKGTIQNESIFSVTNEVGSVKKFITGE
jgi:glycine cleavage system transcriptional repressor